MSHHTPIADRPCPAGRVRVSMRHTCVGLTMRATVSTAVILLCITTGCTEKKNANKDIQKNQTSLMDQMDKIAAQEEAKQAEAKKKAEADAAKPVDPAKNEPATQPKPAEKSPM